MMAVGVCSCGLHDAEEAERGVGLEFRFPPLVLFCVVLYAVY
jgi:hypothetical protein